MDGLSEIQKEKLFKDFTTTQLNSGETKLEQEKNKEIYLLRKNERIWIAILSAMWMIKDLTNQEDFWFLLFHQNKISKPDL